MSDVSQFVPFYVILILKTLNFEINIYKTWQK